MVIKFLNALLTVAYGIGGALVLYWILNKLAELLPGKLEDRVKPYLYILPAFAAIAVFLLYPAVQTVVYSFANDVSTQWVGTKNYSRLLANKNFREALSTTLLWIIVAPLASVAFGLMVAVLVDRLTSRSEKLAKTIVFLPMAVSAVGAATVWKLVYSRSPGETQVGLLNGIITKFGVEPQPWLQNQTLFFNSLLLMVMFLWGQVGYSMVLLSAAIKGVPGDTLEAARIDGANERQIFRRVVFPQVMPTVVTVYVTVMIGVMKLFDIVFVMTGGNWHTNVIATEFYNQMTTNFDTGAASAIVVLLMIAIIPVMIFQVRQFRREEANR